MARNNKAVSLGGDRKQPLLNTLLARTTLLALRMMPATHTTTTTPNARPTSTGAATSTFTGTQLLVVLFVLSLLVPTHVDAFGTCRSSFRCLNGGEERYGQSIFGPCRCRCRPGYTGPRCQYREVTRKRSSSFNLLNDFLQARLRAERLQQQQQQQEQEESFVSADEDELLDRSRRRRSGVMLRALFLRR